MCGNIISDQKLTLYRDDESENDSGEEDSIAAPKSKLRKVDINLENVFSKQKDSELLLRRFIPLESLMIVEIKEKKDDKTFTVRIDDTIKAAGRHLYDVKSKLVISKAF